MVQHQCSKGPAQWCNGKYVHQKCGRSCVRFPIKDYKIGMCCFSTKACSIKD